MASGIKCKYNCARISRLYLASEFRTNPPTPNRSSMRPPATSKFRAPASAFAPDLKIFLFSASIDVHLLMKIFNRTIQAASTEALFHVPARILSPKYNMRCDSAIVAIPSYTDRTTAIQLLKHSMRHVLSDAIFTSPIPMVT